MTSAAEAQFFGARYSAIRALGDVALTAEAYANAIFDLFSTPSPDSEPSPADDLFQREKWRDLLTLLVPASSADASAFVGTCMRRALRRAVVPANKVGDAVSRILAILDSDYSADVVTEIVRYTEEGRWEDIVTALVHRDTHPTVVRAIAWSCQQITADPDGLVATVDVDAAKGRIVPAEAVTRLMDRYYTPQRLMQQGVAELIDRLLPTAPGHFRDDCKKIVNTQLAEERQIVFHTVVEHVEKVTAPPPPSATDLEEEAWHNALGYVEQLAKLVEPLHRAGLDSNDALTAAEMALSNARAAIEQRLAATPPPSSPRTIARDLSAIAPNYGATILGNRD